MLTLLTTPCDVIGVQDFGQAKNYKPTWTQNHPWAFGPRMVLCPALEQGPVKVDTPPSCKLHVTAVLLHCNASGCQLDDTGPQLFKSGLNFANSTTDQGRHS